MNLWAWAHKAWATPGVERACLDLQDLTGQSVSLLLWRAWCEAERRPVDLERARAAVDLVRPIETEILRPLRTVRRALSESRPGLAEKARRGLRDRLRTVELDFEQVLLEALEALASQPVGEATSRTDALVNQIEIWSGSALGEESRALVEALSKALA